MSLVFLLQQRTEIWSASKACLNPKVYESTAFDTRDLHRQFHIPNSKSNKYIRIVMLSSLAKSHWGGGKKTYQHHRRSNPHQYIQKCNEQNNCKSPQRNLSNTWKSSMRAFSLPDQDLRAPFAVGGIGIDTGRIGVWHIGARL